MRIRTIFYLVGIFIGVCIGIIIGDTGSAWFWGATAGFPIFGSIGLLIDNETKVFSAMSPNRRTFALTMQAFVIAFLIYSSVEAIFTGQMYLKPATVVYRSVTPNDFWILVMAGLGWAVFLSIHLLHIGGSQ